MDCLMPLASLPAEIAGRNRMSRRMMIDAIRTDPEWLDGNYTTQPRGLVTAIYILLFMGSTPRQWQKDHPTADAADAFLAARVEDYLSRMDANDFLYQVSASRDYNPAPGLAQIKAPLLAINSADDQVNPPELGIMEAAITQVPNGRYILLPITDATRGHGTHTLAAIWQHHLAELLAETVV
jgi:homoserine O-acetyltransferase